MEGFCRGCLIKYDEPMELLQYTEKNRRLFVYSTGLQVKRNDTFTFQLCKDCFLNMKQACKFKKLCRTSDKRFKNYLALKNVGDPVDFCTFLKNNDETLTFRLPMISGSSTPATQKCRDDDNESTCTSIRNFMTDILQGEEMPDTEARIIKEVIEEEADVLDDSLDSHWMQDDMSIDTDFRLDFSFSPFSTPHSVNNDRCYTPKQSENQVTFDTINSKKQTEILNDFTNAFKTDENITEHKVFGGEVSSIEKSENYNNAEELSPFSMEIDAMNTLDSKTNKSDQNMKELCEFGIENIDSIHNTESNQNMKDLCNFGKDEVDGIANSKSNQSITNIMSNLGVDETDAIGKSESNNLKSNRDIQELFDFSLDDINSVDKAENKVLKNVTSLKELCDLSLDSVVSIEKTTNKIINKKKNLKEIYDLSLNSFDDTSKSERKAFNTERNIKEIFDFGIEISGMDKSVSNMDLPSLPDVLEKDKIDTPDFDIPKGLVGSIQSSNDVSNGSINLEALLKEKPCTIDKNLEMALKNTDNEKFSLEDLLTSPPAATTASTPTITNILFGEKLDTPDTKIKIGQCIEPSHDVQGDIEIFEEFFQNDTKEFDLEDIIKENERFKPEDWKKLIADNCEVNNKENEFKKVDMDITFGDKDKDRVDNKVAEITGSEIKGITYFFDTAPNDKFDIETFYCKLCNIKYETGRALSVHFVKTHNIKIIKAKYANQVAKEYIADTSLNDKFDIENAFCKLCNKQYKTRKALSIHFSMIHKIRIAKQKNDKNNESRGGKICSQCGEIFKNPSVCTNHMKICQETDKIFKCDSCQEEFKTQIHLEKHQSSHTQLKKPISHKKEFVCSICGAIMHKQSNLTIHMKRHTKDYVIKCDVCDKGFYRRRDLDLHMRCHTGETPYACKFCPMLYSRRDVLTRHVLTHLGEKLFECDYCNKKFYKKWDLIQHIKRKSCWTGKISKKRNKTDKKKNNIDKRIEEEKVENKEIEEEIKDVEKDITIMYAKESNATIKAQLPFIETERSN